MNMKVKASIPLILTPGSALKLPEERYVCSALTSCHDLTLYKAMDIN